MFHIFADNLHYMFLHFMEGSDKVITKFCNRSMRSPGNTPTATSGVRTWQSTTCCCVI